MTLRTTTEPPAGVLAAFRLAGAPRPLAGGQGQSFRVGNAVLKPVNTTEEAEWCAEVFAGLTSTSEFRVPRPCRADDGSYVVAGWAAFEFVDGQAGPAGEWATLIAAGRAFHRALRHLPRPGLLDRRQHPWAVADRIAWGEISSVTSAHTNGLLATLQDLQRPVDAPSQLVHGDLTGNVLLMSGRPPAVIDFSPYWRPAGYAEAIVVADGLLYHRAEPELVDRVLPGRDGLQMLIRALTFRLATTALFEGPSGTLPQEELARFARVTRLVAERIHTDHHFGIGLREPEYRN
ncbi:TIGR02569 family protein [Streptosporangium sp. NPDC020145]|uniref:TIGR02569 family protein n=1 Tax=Streptosporangium sp. NPDC020145 TaxID=3154694 RepID=UPI00341BDEFF